jgi:hypothetical protein
MVGAVMVESRTITLGSNTDGAFSKSVGREANMAFKNSRIAYVKGRSTQVF